MYIHNFAVEKHCIRIMNETSSQMVCIKWLSLEGYISNNRVSEFCDIAI